MVRTQIYLTDEEQAALAAIANKTGKSKSDLIRQAIDHYIEQFQERDRKSLLHQAKGLWRHREDLPDFYLLRRELDRITPQGK